MKGRPLDSPLSTTNLRELLLLLLDVQLSTESTQVVPVETKKLGKDHCGTSPCNVCVPLRSFALKVFSNHSVASSAQSLRKLKERVTNKRLWLLLFPLLSVPTLGYLLLRLVRILNCPLQLTLDRSQDGLWSSL